MGTIGGRIAERLRELGITQAELARRAQVTRQTAGAWSMDDHGMSGENLVRAARALHVHERWLQTGEGPKLLDSKAIESLGDQLSSAAVTGVPLISYLQAGDWSEIADSFEPRDAEEWVETTASVSKRSFALRVHGDSMQPTIPDGSVVIVDPDVHATNGDIVVARLAESEATLKRLEIDGPRTYLAPLNPKYPLLEATDALTIIGVARKVEIDLPVQGASGRQAKAKKPFNG